MTIPTTMEAVETRAYLGHTLRLGTWTWTATTGDFTDTKLVARFGKIGTAQTPAITIVELESDGVGDQGLDWTAGATGVLADLGLTPDQVDLLHTGVGRDADFWITLEEASPSTDVVLLGLDKFSILTTGPDI